MSTLNVVVQRRPDGMHSVLLSGAIDEGSDVEQIFTKVDGDVVINLERVERINSMGVHRWLPVMTKLSESRRVIVEAISYPVVLQANNVANLFGAARVVSCLAPYYCPGCNENRTVLVTADQVVAAAGIPPMNCPRCTSVMEFDELDSYFRFFKTQRPSAPA